MNSNIQLLINQYIELFKDNHNIKSIIYDDIAPLNITNVYTDIYNLSKNISSDKSKNKNEDMQKAVMTMYIQALQENSNLNNRLYQSSSKSSNLENIQQTGGSTNEIEQYYKAKYLKYKSKYLQLKTRLK